MPNMFLVTTLGRDRPIGLPFNFYDASHLCRYVCWSASILKSHPKLRSALGFAKSDEDDPDTAPLDYSEKINLDQKVYSQYYVTDDTEVGTLMDTRIAIKEVGLKTSSKWK